MSNEPVCFEIKIELLLQELPFPAVTLKAVKLHHAQGLLETTVNMYQFDCFTTSGNEAESCLKDASILREDFRPFIGKALTERFQEAYRMLKTLKNDQKPTNTHPAYHAANYLCQFSRKHKNRYWGHLVTLLFWLDGELAINKDTMTEQLLKVVIDNFRYFYSIW